ncbi:MAG TPA: dTDP-4-dehydrorhamnose 3,5-epimerase, partial [Planctomycetota bacterium]|nr:dTDP-4-dehydrorhamnose 3,5-epimerase [Planctomycetota bacterium]
MRFLPTELPEVVIVEPDVRHDDRGWFLETWQAARYRAGGIDATFVQDNLSRSTRGTLRGLHAQRERPQGKLVQVVEGSVFDVAVDIRRDSPTFLRWVGATLSSDDARQIWVPPGFAHGFCVTSEHAVVEYKCTAPWTPSGEIRIARDDPAIGIRWPV